MSLLDTVEPDGVIGALASIKEHAEYETHKDTDDISKLAIKGGQLKSILDIANVALSDLPEADNEKSE